MIAVHASVWPLFDLFRRSERAWRYPPQGGPPLGLDLVQVRAIADALQVAWDTDTLDALQAMEATASKVFADDWKRKNPPPKPAGH